MRRDSSAIRHPSGHTVIRCPTPDKKGYTCGQILGGFWGDARIVRRVASFDRPQGCTVIQCGKCKRFWAIDLGDPPPVDTRTEPE